MPPCHHRPRCAAILAALLACGPRAAGPADSGDADATGEGPSEDGSDGVSATGPSIEPACGSDGTVLGPIAIRTNDDALALSGCTLVEGDLLVDPCRRCFPELSPGCFECGDPQALTSLAGLESLQRVTGSVFVGWGGDIDGGEGHTGHERLASIAELGGLVEVEGDLHLGFAPLVEFAEFPVLERVRGELRVADAFAADVDVPFLRDVGQLTLVGPARDTFSFPSLERLSSLWLRGTRMASLGGAPGLKDLGDVHIEHDEAVSDLSPLLTVPASGSVSIYSLPLVVAVDLPTAGPATSIGISQCPSLERVSIPPDVDTISALYLWSNGAMTTLDFAGLRDLPYGLILSGNDKIASLDGLANLQSVDEDFIIAHNPSLCQSAVDAFVDGLQIGDEIEHWSVDSNGGC